MFVHEAPGHTKRRMYHGDGTSITIIVSSCGTVRTHDPFHSLGRSFQSAILKIHHHSCKVVVAKRARCNISR
jgi:hypothetical protein